MLTDYESFYKHLVDTLQIRSRNYVNTDCDIEAAIEAVYRDISNIVRLEWIAQEYIVDKSVEKFQLQNDNSTPNAAPTERYGPETDIVDEKYRPISEKLLNLDQPGSFGWRDRTFRNSMDGKPIYFIRPVTYDIHVLPSHLYDIIFPAVLEGIIHWIEASIPSQIDAAIENRNYMRFYNEKRNLINRFPQIKYFDNRLPERIIRWEPIPVEIQ